MAGIGKTTLRKWNILEELSSEAEIEGYLDAVLADIAEGFCGLPS